MNKAHLLDGAMLKEKRLSQIKSEVDVISGGNVKPPRIDVVIVDGDPSSQRYVQMKKQAAEECGFESVIHRFESNVSTAEIIDKINELNSYPQVTGFFVQLPLPAQVDTDQVLAAIDPQKDIDGLNPINLGKLFHSDDSAILSATPRGILMLLEEYKIELEGKDVVIVGWSKIVGMPLLAALSARGATVTICHDKTVELEEKTSRADILISATGVPGLIKGEHVKNQAVVVDVGFSVDKEGRLRGDIDFESVSKKASWLTPVPGGVGPMTIAALMSNLLDLWKRSN